ncbi:hypothetical protein C1S70_31150 (plasmid) [Azospirillum argentinense]|uniref:Uncharacterized protein n=1 Tax=Azospirillum argentinense TaxID=2970906 RepID=A0A2K1FR69_9PROT|nr:hypothetical protein C1S70_31150 [Azospirillum argentinense]
MVQLQAAAIANHASNRTIQLCDWWRVSVSLDEIKRIRISGALLVPDIIGMMPAAPASILWCLGN